MKSRFIFLSFFFFIFFASFAQQDTLNRLDSKGLKQGYWKKYKQNILIYEGQFIDNVPVGIFNYYHKNGKLKSTAHFLNGPLKVKTVIFHENGQRAAEGIFLDQIKDSIWNYYNEKGVLIKTESYLKGKKEGKWATYSSRTGILLEEMHFHNDIIDGVYKEFYANGDIQTIMHYINGKRNGITTSYYADSIVSISGLYHNDYKIGKWSYYDYNGILRKEIQFNRSIPENILFVFYNGSNSQLINQELIAYFQKTGNKTKIVLKNRKIFMTTDGLEIIKDFIDFVDFSPVTPNIIAANESIISFRDITPERIQVFLHPAPEFEIYAEGNEARIIKMLFDRTPIIEE